MVKVIKKFFDCFFLLRIPLLAPVWTIIILGWITGSGKAVAGGCIAHSGHGLGNEIVLWTSLLGFSLIVASIYVINQIVDIESDRINHKLFFLPQGIISISTAWILASACCVSGILIGILFIDWYITLIFACCILLGIVYNLPPFAFKNRAWGGVFANFLGHGVFTFLVGWYSAKYGSSSTIDLISLKKGLVSALSPGFANAAVFITTTIADAVGDRSTGKKTFCVRYGERFSAFAASIACALAILFAFTFEYNRWVMLVPSILSLCFFVGLYMSPKRKNAFLAFKWPVFLLSAFVAVFVPVYGLLILATFFGSRFYYKKRFNIEYPTFKAQ